MKIKLMISVVSMMALSLFLSLTTYGSYYVTLKDNAFDPGKGKSILTMFVTNDSNEMKAIEMTSFKRDLSPSGKELVTETEDLVLIPSQLIIPPRSEKAVSLRWTGTKLIRQELSYRVIVDEVDVGRRQKNNTKMIKTRLRFVKAIYVAPKAVKESIRLLKAYRSIAKDGSYRLMVKVLNNGTVHTLFHNMVLEYNTSGKKIASIKISASHIEPFKKTMNILPGRSVEGWIPWPDKVDTSVQRFNLLYFNVEDEEKDKSKKEDKSKKT